MRYPLEGWLERQLAGRAGIDAEACGVYARCVLSVLRARHDAHDARELLLDLDDEDDGGDDRRCHQSRQQQQQQRRRKESGRNKLAGRSPLLLSCEEAEQLRRSAAVRCLQSASSGQKNCEIESLVDELCEKLKEVNNNTTPPLETAVPHNESQKPKRKLSQKELTERYYAAFPPLCRQNSNLVNFVPKWIPSSSAAQGSPKKKKKHKKQPEKYDTSHHGTNIKPKSHVLIKQHPPSYIPRTNKKTCHHNFTERIQFSSDFKNWDFLMLNKSLTVPRSTMEFESMQNINFNSKADQEMNMYSDLPVDISDLLSDSPNSQVEMMNLANTNNNNRSNYIPNGTNIISSIWSTNENEVDTGKNDDWPDYYKSSCKNGVNIFGHLTRSSCNKEDDFFEKLQASTKCNVLSRCQQGFEHAENSSIKEDLLTGNKFSCFVYDNTAVAKDVFRADERIEKIDKILYKAMNDDVDMNKLQCQQGSDAKTHFLRGKDEPKNSFSFFSNDRSKDFQADARFDKADQIVCENGSDEDVDMSMYDDLPVDISSLLNDSSDSTKEMICCKNHSKDDRKELSKSNVNVFSSVWSCNQSENELAFSSVSTGTNTWPGLGAKKQVTGNNNFLHNLPNTWSRNEDLFDKVTVSLLKINHSKESSCFKEVTPRPKPISKPFSSFRQPIISHRRKSFQIEKNDDLLTSEKSHFKPINEKLENTKVYEDGTTFVISNNIDKVDYKRSSTGSMYLEDELGQRKRYCEYKNKDKQISFALKFCMSENDKSCQTEDLTHIEDTNMGLDDQAMEKGYDLEETSEKCTCGEKDDCLFHPNALPEVNWDFKLKTCEKCQNNNDTWDTEWPTKEKVGSEWDNDDLRNIWKGGEVCQDCLRLNEGRTSRHHNQLREDISQDGEQLLSDLSTLHQAYVEGGPEIKIDVKATIIPSFEDRKRRHSFMEEGTNWSFASRLEEYFMVRMASLPTLRSVAL